MDAPMGDSTAYSADQQLYCDFAKRCLLKNDRLSKDRRKLLVVLASS